MQYRQFHAAMCEKQLKKNTKFKNCEKLSDVSRQSPLGLGSCNTTELAGGTVIVQLYLSFSSCWFNFCTSLVFLLITLFLSHCLYVFVGMATRHIYLCSLQSSPGHSVTYVILALYGQNQEFLSSLRVKFHSSLVIPHLLVNLPPAQLLLPAQLHHCVWIHHHFNNPSLLHSIISVQD